MNESDHRVVLIARDASLVDAIAAASQPLGHPLRHFESVDAWLQEASDNAMALLGDSGPLFAGVLVLSQVAGAEQSLQELQQVCDLRCSLPVVVVSNHLSVTDAVATMRTGAFTVLTHPCPAEELSEAITAAIALAEKRLPAVVLATTASRRWQELNEDERYVMQRLLDGKVNKEIAHSLEISLRTVELRRSRIMKKMRASSLPELVRLVCAAQSIS